MKKITPEAATIRVNMARNLIESRQELADITGIDRQRLYKRFRHPEDFRLYELRAIIIETHMPDNEILAVVKGIWPQEGMS